jgi:hypothetical protein
MLTQTDIYDLLWSATNSRISRDRELSYSEKQAWFFLRYSSEQPPHLDDLLKDASVTIFLEPNRLAEAIDNLNQLVDEAFGRDRERLFSERFAQDSLRQALSKLCPIYPFC